MMNRISIILIIICGLFLLIISSCKKDDGKDYNVVPHIELLGLNRTQVKSFSDTLVFTIRYEDGDGDLGENDADVKNLFITDNRINITYGYRIQELAPDGANIPIRGELQVELPGIAITDGSAQQVATFTIYLLDRAGNQSNSVTSGTVTIIQ